ncbi:MAG: four helix bundle protein [Candidatus Omnitrophota bacterium]
MTQQIRRSVISIPSNIAEGFRRKYSKEYKQFLHIALGSCAELETQVVIANRLKCLCEGDQGRMVDLINYICKMIVNLVKKL